MECTMMTSGHVVVRSGCGCGDDVVNDDNDDNLQCWWRQLGFHAGDLRSDPEQREGAVASPTAAAQFVLRAHHLLPVWQSG